MRPRWSIRTTDEWRPDGGYVIAGSVLEATNAGRALAAWRISAGRVNGVDVSGQVIVTFDDRTAAKGGGCVMLLDEAATPEQALALVDAFSGRLGGPLADLVGPQSRDRSFAQVPLQYRVDGGVVSVLVPGRLRLVAGLDGGATAEVLVTACEHDLVWHDDRARLTHREFRWSFHAQRRSS